jgi:diguanylate cyclase (GGDEF)-like protein
VFFDSARSVFSGAGSSADAVIQQTGDRWTAVHLDPATLLIVSSATTLLVGTLFLTSWRQAPESRALALWGTAHLVGAVGSAGLALRGQIPDLLSIGLSNAVVLAAYGLIWSGVRSFEGRAACTGWAMAGAVIWCALCAMPAFYESIVWRIVYASAVATLYCGAATVELWRGRAERLASRITAGAVLGLHGAFYLVRIPSTLLAPPQLGHNPLASPWVAILCFVTMLFSIASAFTFMALVKERAEREQRIAAYTDALTGVPNRRAFAEAAAAALAARRGGALLLFDLDRFKAVNDVHGHAVGDAVLVGFCTMATTLLPPDAMLGRLGGEEFACLLPDVSPAEALGRAEELRRTFAQLFVPEIRSLRVSVSIGIAQARSGIGFETLMRRADSALYVAKNSGRDRVSVAEWAAARAA